MNSDDYITLVDSSQWTALFITSGNLLTIVEKNRNTGECMTGKYFWAENMILIDLPPIIAPLPKGYFIPLHQNCFTYPQISNLQCV